jgi:hypothetical protein
MITASEVSKKPGAVQKALVSTRKLSRYFKMS